MKKILLMLAVLVVIGCDEQRKEYQNGADSVYIVTVEGHKYIIYDGYHQGGIVHAESCGCKDVASSRFKCFTICTIYSLYTIIY